MGGEGGCDGAMIEKPQPKTVLIDVQVRGMCTDGSRALQEYLINPARADSTFRGRRKVPGPEKERGDASPRLSGTGRMCPLLREPSREDGKVEVSG